MKLKKPGYPGNLAQFASMWATFYLTSENATPKKEFSYLKTKQN